MTESPEKPESSHSNIPQPFE